MSRWIPWRSTTDPSGESNRLNRNQPGTSLSTNIMIYGDQSDSTDEAPILKRLLYRTHERMKHVRNYYETVQESLQIGYVAQPGTSTQNYYETAHPGGSNIQKGKKIPKITNKRQNSNQKTINTGKAKGKGKGKKMGKNKEKTSPPMMTIAQSANDIDEIVGCLAEECMEGQIGRSWYLYRGIRGQMEWDITLKLHPPKEERNNQNNNNDSSISHPNNESTKVNSNISELRSLRCVPEENRLKTLRIKSEQ